MDELASAFEHFCSEADEEIRFRTCLRAAQQDLHGYLRGQGPLKNPRFLRGGRVYLAQRRGEPVYKIGETVYLTGRIQVLSTQADKPVDLVHVCEADDRLAGERFLHQLFRGTRLHGEWFTWTERQVAWVKGLGREWKAKEWARV
jgi:hypothetical protein